jgi:hypothetical protein
MARPEGVVLSRHNIGGDKHVTQVAFTLSMAW